MQRYDRVWVVKRHQEANFKQPGWGIGGKYKQMVLI
jgi:hypothetical protein